MYKAVAIPAFCLLQLELIVVVSINFHLAGQLFLSLRGTPIDGDGFVNVDDIGNNDNADNAIADGLLCLTTATDCCSGNQGRATGNWFFPNGTALPTIVNVRSGTGFGRDRALSAVRLFRFNNPSERGRFRCDLLGDTIYVNICE